MDCSIGNQLRHHVTQAFYVSQECAVRNQSTHQCARSVSRHSELNSACIAGRSLIAHGRQIKHHVMTWLMAFRKIAILSAGRPRANTSGKHKWQTARDRELRRISASWMKHDRLMAALGPSSARCGDHSQRQIGGLDVFGHRSDRNVIDTECGDPLDVIVVFDAA